MTMIQVGVFAALSVAIHFVVLGFASRRIGIAGSVLFGAAVSVGCYQLWVYLDLGILEPFFLVAATVQYAFAVLVGTVVSLVYRAAIMALPPRTAAITLAVVHVMMFVGFVAYYFAVNQRDGQAMLLWGYWLVIDFPVSLLVPLGWLMLSADSPMAQYWLYAVHGVAGTAWWYCVPLIAARVYQAIRPRS